MEFSFFGLGNQTFGGLFNFKQCQLTLMCSASDILRCYFKHQSSQRMYTLFSWYVRVSSINICIAGWNDWMDFVFLLCANFSSYEYKWLQLLALNIHIELCAITGGKKLWCSLPDDFSLENREKDENEMRTNWDAFPFIWAKNSYMTAWYIPFHIKYCFSWSFCFCAFISWVYRIQSLYLWHNITHINWAETEFCWFFRRTLFLSLWPRSNPYSRHHKIKCIYIYKIVRTKTGGVTCYIYYIYMSWMVRFIWLFFFGCFIFFLFGLSFPKWARRDG